MRLDQAEWWEKQKETLETADACDLGSQGAVCKPGDISYRDIHVVPT